MLGLSVPTPKQPVPSAPTPRVPGAAVGFAPTSIAGCVLWLAADRLTGYGDGDAVSSWTDLSGKGYSPSQATAANRPLYRTGALNGKPVVRFDGTNDTLGLTNFSEWNGTGATLLVVFKTRLATQDRKIVAGTNTKMAVEFDTTQMYPDISGTVFAQYAWHDALAHVATNVYDGSQASNATRLVHYLDGTQKTLSFTGTVPATLPVGNALDVGSFGVSAFYIDDIAEVIAYNRGLGTSDLTTLHRYLGTKWGVTVP